MAATSAPAKKAKPEAFASGYDFLLANGEISDSLYVDILNCVSAKKSGNKSVVLILVTYGGQANPGYRIGRYLQSVYDEVVVFVPSYCKSAGTLVACAANRLVFGPFGEIGPLDVQLLQRDEIFGNRSGLTTRSALSDISTHAFDLFEHFMLEIKRKSKNAVSFRLASEVSARITGEMMSKLYEQINPELLGQDFRDLSIATQYATRLNRQYHNIKAGGISRLVNDYPSHDFVIDLEEAKEIFERVETTPSIMFGVVMKRPNDCLIPKTKGQIVEMLTMPDDAAGHPDAPAKTDAAKAAKSAPTERTDETQPAGGKGNNGGADTTPG